MLWLKGWRRVPLHADALTHHKPSSSPIQRPCPLPHHVPYRCCVIEMNKVIFTLAPFLYICIQQNKTLGE